MELSQDERQKFLELIDKVSPCAAISEKENLEKFKEWLNSDMSKRVTFVEAPKIFKDQVGNDKVLLSARESTGASLMPSPTKASFLCLSSSRRNSSTFATLSCGSSSL